MKTSNQSKNLALLAESGFTVLSGNEGLDICIKQIGWNLRSLMRQSDILETKIVELRKQSADYVAATSGENPGSDQNIAQDSDAAIKEDD